MEKLKVNIYNFSFIGLSCAPPKVKALIRLSFSSNLDTEKVSFISSICSCLLYMHAEVTHAKDKELEFKIHDIDISILYIIQHELQKNSDNKFAGVVLKHPLIREYRLKMLTNKNDPQKALEESVQSAIKYTNDLAGIMKLTIGS
jgi:DNA-directed RNA polymerase subunit L